MSTQDNLSPERLVEECQKAMAHAWMVRCFVKESSEVEEFPELMGIVRTVFDLSRALDSRVHDPEAYFQALRKRIDRLREAAIQFRTDALEASTDVNFRQAALSMEACVEQLQSLLETAREGTEPAADA